MAADWLDDLMKQRDALDSALLRDRVRGYVSVGLGPVERGKGVELGLVVFHQKDARPEQIPSEFNGVPVGKVVLSDGDETPIN